MKWDVKSTPPVLFAELTTNDGNYGLHSNFTLEMDINISEHMEYNLIAVRYNPEKHFTGDAARLNADGKIKYVHIDDKESGHNHVPGPGIPCGDPTTKRLHIMEKSEAIPVVLVYRAGQVQAKGNLKTTISRQNRVV